MRELTELLDSVLDQTTFDSRSAKKMTPAQLRDAYDREGLHDEEIIEARRAQPVIPDELLLQLNKQLRTLLKDYIDPETDHFGHALPIDAQRRYPVDRHHGERRETFQSNGLLSIAGVSAVEDLNKGLIKGAAVIGAERVTHLLSGWLQGKPVEYRTSALLNGLPVREPLAPVNGIRIEPLPLSTGELPASLPRHRGMAVEDYLGRTVVSVDSSAAPALFHPQVKPSEQNVHANNVGDVDIDTVTQGLSLESDSYVDVAFRWNDYQELGAFSQTGGSSSWSTGNASIRRGSPPVSYSTDSSTGITTLQFMHDHQMLDISEESLAQTLEALKTLKHSDKTRIAVSRWVKSKDSYGQQADRFIDLRIALESLYLRNIGNEKDRGEMRFRLPLIGAWHLGSDLEERKKVRKNLREAYDTASKAVHGGPLAVHGDALEYFKYQQLLSTAQDMCRRGILKLLKEESPSDWEDLILGIENS